MRQGNFPALDVCPPSMKFLVVAATSLVAAVGSARPPADLPDVGPAPALVGSTWINTEKPITLKSLKGKVVLVHFWTLACINCKHNLPQYNEWFKQFKDQKFAMIGIHTPELDFERELSNVQDAVKAHDIKYPVLVDGKAQNWDNWRQEYWPAIYLLDKRGHIRERWNGELEFNHAGGTARIEREIKELLDEPDEAAAPVQADSPRIAP